MNKSEIAEKYKIGSYIRKNSYEPFRTQDHNFLSFVKINKIIVHNNRIFINDFWSFAFHMRMPLVISKEEALAYEEKWHQTKLDIENLSESRRKEFEHFREDNGQPKEALSLRQARIVLFRFRNKNPQGNYELYKCSTCGEIHIGKVPVEMLIEK